ncbi:MAG: HAMP domain-containing protein [Anaerolineae bacterium]|nr:HAMP domain-containing protein [Anaerolineae bacterium]
MTLRRRTLVIIGITLLSLIGILYLFAQTILLNGFIRLETQSLQQDVNRLTSAFKEITTQLDNFNRDWAGWDDTYAFVQDRNEDYIHDNLLDQFYINQRLNLTLFVNTKGQIVYGKQYDLENEQTVPVAPDIQTHLSPDGLLNLPYITSKVIGLLDLEEGHLLFTSRPILTSDYQGPTQGTIIMGQFLDQSMINHLAATTHLSVQIWPIDSPSLPADAQAIKTQLSTDNPIVVQPLDSDTVGGYTAITDIYGNPTLLVRVDKVRDVYGQGQVSISYFLLALVITGLVFVSVVLLLIERTVLARLSALSRAVDRVRASTDNLSITMPTHGKDELGLLGANMRAMLVTIQQYQDELREANADLENHVQMRTQELAKVVVQLLGEIAEKEQVQVELAQARDQAIEAFKLKGQILANVSHDARTPLNVIMLSADMLQRYSGLDERWSKKIDNIQTSANQLLNFFNNLLEEARHSSGTYKVQKAAFAPRDLLDNIVSPMSALAHDKDLRLTTELAEDVPACLNGDEKRLGQIVSNLVSNAIKFTARGSIHVRCFRPDTEHWAIAVTDTGRGIAVEDQPQIFNAFWQVDGSMTREIMSGVGLGLSIVKQSATLLGGRVDVQSEVGIGTTFTVTLPLEEATKNE